MFVPTTAPVIMFGFKLLVKLDIENTNEVTKIARDNESANPFIMLDTKLYP